jgi:hypothetical protein
MEKLLKMKDTECRMTAREGFVLGRSAGNAPYPAYIAS